MKAISTIVFGSLAIGSVSAILGGKSVHPGTYNYTAFLTIDKGGDPVCGAILIDPKHVLTAASCTGQEPTYVSVGQYVSDPQDADVLKIVKTSIHPEFFGSTFGYDLAVLTLERSSKFHPAQLPTSPSTVMPGDLTTALGWGSANPSDFFEVSDKLRRVHLKVWENDDCRVATGFRFINHHFLCAGGVEHKGLTFVDQGGPLILENGAGDGNDVVVGVAFYALGGVKGKPSVFIRTSSELHWLRAQL